jgi:hypothetical protein
MKKSLVKGLPNFLIVGAAKSGTTAVSHYLEQHPEVFISPIKEPKFISSHFVEFPLQGPGDDFVENFTIKAHREYRGLFRKVEIEKAIGEASVENLYYYKKAIPVIKQLLGEVKIIIMLRNPVDRAFSAYKMMVRDGRESLSFEEALQKEEKRKERNWEYLWSYKEVGFYYEQVKAYLEAFRRVKVVLFDDFRNDTIAFMQDLYRFLGVNDSFLPRVDIRFNTSGRLKSTFYRFLFRATGFKGMLYKYLSMNGVSDTKILSVIESIRDGELEPIQFQLSTREKLTKLYKNDIEKLSALLGRDLGMWL